MTSLHTDLRAASRLAPVALYGGAALLVGLLVAASAVAPTVGALSLGAAAFVAITATIGVERVGLVLLAAGYFTAPFYKGVTLGGGDLVTAPDVLVAAGFALLLPRLLRGQVRFPPAYVVGVALVLLSGLLASTFAEGRAESFSGVLFWMIVMVGLPVAIALWSPDGREIDLLAVAFVAGQVYSLLMGYVQGNEGQGRQAGLATHPNYLAQAGMLALCLLFYLYHRHRHRNLVVRGLMAGAAAACLVSVVTSGSRAATVVVAVLLLMIPIVERSALGGFLTAALGALLVAGLPAITGLTGAGSSLSRLGGGVSSSMSNTERTEGLDAGIERFFGSPLLGSGLVDLFDIHNNFLEVAVSVGVFGLAGYLLVMFSFGRPLFGRSEHRRLAYATWAYLGLGATVPGLYDRSVWLVVALGAVSMALPPRSETTAGSARPLGPASAVPVRRAVPAETMLVHPPPARRRP